MQADGSAPASSKHARGRLPFHLSSLDFHVSPDKLQLLTSEQLALVQFHPDTTEALKAKAEILFFRRREKDQHLLETLADIETSEWSPTEGPNGSHVSATQEDASSVKSVPSGPCTDSAEPSSISVVPESSYQRTELVRDDTESLLASVRPPQPAEREVEDGEVTDPAKTPTPECMIVKDEFQDDDLIMLDGYGAARSSRQLSSKAGGSRRTSIPLALNMGSTYSGKRGSKGTASESVEPPASTSTSRACPYHRSSASQKDLEEDGTASRKGRSSKGRPERASSARNGKFSGRKRRRESPHKSEKGSPSRRPTASRSSKRKKRRRRSYTSSSESSCSSSSSSYSGESSSSDCSGSSSSYTSSRSRSASPDRRRRRRHRPSHRPQPMLQPQPYSAVPVPMQMQIPLAVIPTQSEEELSRQQLSHMYRNMPSNPAELGLRATTSYTASPPRPAQNNVAFPGQFDRGPTSHPNHLMNRRGSIGNMHPARVQAMGGGPAPNMYDPSPPYNGLENRRDGRPGSHTLPIRPNATGWPDPPAPAPRRNAGWPDDRPNRPRQDRPPPARNNWGGSDHRTTSSGDGWGDSIAKATGSTRAHSPPKAADSAWGDTTNSNSDPWGESSTSANTKGAAMEVNDPWGSPPAAAAKKAPLKTGGSAWGDNTSTNQGSSAWD